MIEVKLGMIILIDFTFITLVYSRGKAETTPYP